MERTLYAVLLYGVNIPGGRRFTSAEADAELRVRILADLETALAGEGIEPIKTQQAIPPTRLQRQTRRDGETGQTVVLPY